MRKCSTTTKQYLLPHLIKQAFSPNLVQSDCRKCFMTTKHFLTIQPKVNAKNVFFAIQ